MVEEEGRKVETNKEKSCNLPFQVFLIIIIIIIIIITTTTTCKYFNF